MQFDVRAFQPPPHPPQKKNTEKINCKFPFQKRNVPKFETKNIRRNFFHLFIKEVIAFSEYPHTHRKNVKSTQTNQIDIHEWFLGFFFFSVHITSLMKRQQCISYIFFHFNVESQQPQLFFSVM